MSGCHPTDSPTSLLDRILQLEKICEGLDCVVSGSVCRINKLDKENEMRINTIGYIDTAYNDAFLDIEKRLNKLESSTLTQELDPKVWYHISKRLDAIEPIVNVAEKVLEQMGKKPYKCPNCDFSGALQLESVEEVVRFGKDVMHTSDGKPFIWCIACKGNGIVWG